MRVGRPACSLFRSRAHLGYMTLPHASSTVAHFDRPVHIARAAAIRGCCFPRRIECNFRRRHRRQHICLKSGVLCKSTCQRFTGSGRQVQHRKLDKQARHGVRACQSLDSFCAAHIDVSLNHTTSWRPELPHCTSEYGRRRSSLDRREQSRPKLSGWQMRNLRRQGDDGQRHLQDILSLDQD